jgi:hypothetical protein
VCKVRICVLNISCVVNLMKIIKVIMCGRFVEGLCYGSGYFLINNHLQQLILVHEHLQSIERYLKESTNLCK